MNLRIISACIMIIALAVLAWLDYSYLNLAVLSVLLVLGFLEAKRLFSVQNANTFLALIAFLLCAKSYNPLLTGACFVIIVLGFCAYFGKELKLVLPFLYPFLPLLAIWQLLDFEGMRVFIWLLFIVGGCDSFAYFFGKRFGKTPFCKTSPNKTLEGLFAGLVCAVAIGSVYGFFFIHQSFGYFLKISFFTALFAIIGDLVESYFKRLAGVKDSGTLIPGHGGVLDRLDAAMLACFAMLVLQ